MGVQKIKMKHSCPVCGFSGMPYAPVDYNICPCCGTEFGLDDVETSHADLRMAWVRGGARWFSDELRPEENWNPFIQMTNAGLEYDRSYEPTTGTNQFEEQATVETIFTWRAA